MIFNLVTGAPLINITVNGGKNETIEITKQSTGKKIQIGTNSLGVASIKLSNGIYSFKGFKSNYTVTDVVVSRSNTNINVFPGHILWWYGRLGTDIMIDKIRAYDYVLGDRDIEFTAGWQYYYEVPIYRPDGSIDHWETRSAGPGATNIFFQKTNGSSINFGGNLKGIVWNATNNNTQLVFGVDNEKTEAITYSNITNGLDYYVAPSRSVQTTPPSAISVANIPTNNWYPAVKACDQANNRAVRITALWYE